MSDSIDWLAALGEHLTSHGGWQSIISLSVINGTSQRFHINKEVPLCMYRQRNFFLVLFRTAAVFKSLIWRAWIMG